MPCESGANLPTPIVLSSSSGRASRSGGSILFVSLTYVVIGVATVMLAGGAARAQMRSTVRLAAWLISFIVFAGQITYERASGDRSDRMVAVRCATAVAIAVLIIAIIGPVRTHWGTPDFRRAALSAVVAWPLFTGVVAFVVARAGSAMVAHSMSRHTPAS